MWDMRGLWRCKVCDRIIERKCRQGRGRYREYCSQKCRQREYRARKKQQLGNGPLRNRSITSHDRKGASR